MTQKQRNLTTNNVVQKWWRIFFFPCEQKGKKVEESIQVRRDFLRTMVEVYMKSGGRVLLGRK